MARNTIIYNINSFSSLIALYLVTLDKHFFRALSKYFPGNDGSATPPPPLEKLVRASMIVNKCKKLNSLKISIRTT